MVSAWSLVNTGFLANYYSYTKSCQRDIKVHISTNNNMQSYFPVEPGIFTLFGGCPLMVLILVSARLSPRHHSTNPPPSAGIEPGSTRRCRVANLSARGRARDERGDSQSQRRADMPPSLRARAGSRSRARPRFSPARDRDQNEARGGVRGRRGAAKISRARYLCRVTAAKAARTLPGALSPTPKVPPRERARAHAGLRSVRGSARYAARRVAARRAIL